MSASNDLEKRISGLQDKIELLQAENDHLAERAEDTLLLGLVGEKINTTEDIEKVFELGLERISLLKDIPFCACCSFKDGNLKFTKTFFSFTNDTLQNDKVQLPGAITAKIAAGSYLLQGEECKKTGISIPLQSSQYVPTSIFFIPFESRYDSVNLFFFAEDGEENRLGNLDLLLHRIIEMIASRADCLFLMKALKKLNLELDRKVDSRTNELLEANKDLQQQIIERQQAEDALRESEEHYRSLVENIDLGVTLIDTDHRIVMANSAMGRMFNRSPSGFIDKNCYMEFEKRDRICPHCPGVEAMLTGEPKEVETEGILDDGSTFTAKIRAFPVLDKDGKSEGFIEVVEDITDSKRLMQEVEKAQKLESIGLLAGGIAHDFNNLLTAIVGNISLSRLTKEAHKRNELLGKAEEASFRAQSLTQQLLTFSRGGSPVQVPQPLPQVIQDSADFVLRGSNCIIEYHFAPDLKHVNIDAEQIKQVVQNLVINANQAMPGGGKLTISAVNEVVIDSQILTLGEYVKVIVHDSGGGIPSEIIGQIFDPYFTTKETGTGLGLAISYSVIKKHGGVISVNSNQGEGTVFTFHLPAAESRKASLHDNDKEDIIHGTGTVLIIDDDPNVGETLVNLLDELGYEPYYVTVGEEAVRLLKEKEGFFNVVITDLTIPGSIGGVQIKDYIRQIYPNMKIIVMSGYSNDPVMAKYSEYGFDGIIKKPFRINTVAKILYKLTQ